MIVYLDNEFKCHTINNGTTMTTIETDFFNGKCVDFIEGYRFIPTGKSWIRSDGTVFFGEMITPWKSYTQLDSIQRNYEQEQLKALNILLGEEE